MALITKAQLKARIAELEKQVANLQTKNADLLDQNATLTAQRDAARAELDAVQDDAARYQAEITRLEGKLADAEQSLGEAEADLAASVADLARVQAALDDCQNPPDPEPAKTTLFGVTVTGGVKKNMPDLHDDVKVSRVFLAGTKDWDNDGQHKAFPNGKFAVSCSYALAESDVPTLLDSAEADWDQWVAFADGHELENPDKNLDPADVRARQTRTSKVIRARGLKVASCLMQWTLAPASGRNWLDWVNPDAIDIFCWDAYNSGAKKQTYTDPDNLLDRIIAISKEYGKPWALWETGTNNFGNQAPRVAWTKDLKATIIREKGDHAIWFDRPSTSGSDWDATLDRPTAEAWLL